jgi:hypothetical protein
VSSVCLHLLQAELTELQDTYRNITDIKAALESQLQEVTQVGGEGMDGGERWRGAAYCCIVK